MTTLINVPTRVYLCESCGHAQSDSLPDIRKFYDTEYRISLESEEHDQLYAMGPDGPIYRTDHQAELLATFLDLPKGALLLDYGAAKAATLKKLRGFRPDIVGHVFDVSLDYEASWQSWLPADRCATYSLPDSWKQKFDAVSAYFVLEHVESPIEVLRSIRAVLKPNGKLLFTVPNPLENPGDLLVVDHLNHFTVTSIERTLGIVGFRLLELNHKAFAGGLVVVAQVAEINPNHRSPVDTKSVLEIARFWSKAADTLVRAAKSRGIRKSAIYGAGFYGSFIAARIDKLSRLACFIDRNPHLHGKIHLGLPVIPPSSLPEDVTTVYAGVNPSNARAILAEVPEWNGKKIEKIFMDELE